MKRLTNKKAADAQRREYENRLKNGYPRNIPEERFLKLAAYEDTGLEPEQIGKAMEDCADTVSKAQFVISEINEMGDIDHIRDLVRAEKEGRLVVLPCKVGDTVWTNFAMSGWYFRDKDRPYSAKVVFIGLNDFDAIGKGFIDVAYGKHDFMMSFNFSEIGKTVFLTREEAEEALMEMAGGAGK